VPVRQQYLVTHRRPNRPKLITIPVEDNDLTRTLEDNNRGFLDLYNWILMDPVDTKLKLQAHT
jgi:hypothetical protein